MQYYYNFGLLSFRNIVIKARFEFMLKYVHKWKCALYVNLFSKIQKKFGIKYIHKAIWPPVCEWNKISDIMEMF